MKLLRNTIVQAKNESQYGTAPSSWAASDALLVREASITPISANLVDRNLLNGRMGAQPQLRTTEAVEITFTCELAGSGSAGTAPAWGKLLKACGWAEKTTANTKVDYTPISSSFPSISLRYVVDGTAHIALGCRGTATLDLSVATIPSLAFTFTGLVGTISEISQPSATTTAWKDPIAAETVNTPTATLDGNNLLANSLNIDFGSQINRLEFIGHSEVAQTDRQITGNVTLAAPKLTEKNYFAHVQSGARVAFAMTHGKTAGNIIDLTASRVQIPEVVYGDVDGIVTLEASLRFTPTSGDDELAITSR